MLEIRDRCLSGPIVTRFPLACEAFDLRGFQGRIEHVNRNLLLLVHSKFVHTYDDALPRSRWTSDTRRRIRESALVSNRSRWRPACRPDLSILCKYWPRPLSRNSSGQCFDSVGAAHRIYGIRNAGFMSNDLLRPQSQTRRISRRNRKRFVLRIGVQRLRATQYGRQCLNRTRTMLLSGCCAVSEEPAVCA